MAWFILFACVNRVPQVTDDVFTLSQTVLPDESREALSEDRATFAATCSKCHLLPAPRKHSREEWPRTIDKMRTKHRAKVSPDAEAHILRYMEVAIAWDAKVREERAARRAE